MSELDIQYDFQTENSFETDDTDLAESIITEQTNELTTISKETELSTVSLNTREASWVWEHFTKEYNTKNELKSFIFSNRQSTLDKFVGKPYSRTDQ
ncbi:9369_t:CDS:2 [Gigaspora rosea]|nr:9369_t:CDS:2 [Gigaspora rosea]